MENSAFKVFYPDNKGHMPATYTFDGVPYVFESNEKPVSVSNEKHAGIFKNAGFLVELAEIQAEEPETVNEISPAVASEPVQKRAYRRRPK